MGWNTWNRFGCSINEELVLDSARGIVQSGLKSLGYECMFQVALVVLVTLFIFLNPCSISW